MGRGRGGAGRGGGTRKTTTDGDIARNMMQSVSRGGLASVMFERRANRDNLPKPRESSVELTFGKGKKATPNYRRTISRSETLRNKRAVLETVNAIPIIFT